MSNTENTPKAPAAHVYGQVAPAGKIHVSTPGGHAWCLSGMGAKKFYNIVAIVDQLADRDATILNDIRALKAAGVRNSTILCTKCIGDVRREWDDA